MAPQEMTTQDFFPISHSGGIMPEDEVERLWKMAGFLAKGRMFKDVTQAEQAFSKMLIGYYLGLNPSQSMMGIQLVRGNVMMHYTLMGAFVKSRKGYDYKILEHDNEHALIEFFKDDESLGTAAFSVEDAKTAKLIKGDGAWETWPENMCVARALSKGIRFFMPEALGGIPVYTTGEIPTQQEELTAGEGTGEEPEVELPAEVLAMIERANRLDHPTWSDVSTWKYRTKMSKGDVTSGVLAQSLQEAKADLDAMEAMQEAEVVPEESIPTGSEEQLESERTESFNVERYSAGVDEGLGGEESPPTDATSPPSVSIPQEAPPAQGSVPDSEELQELRRKRAAIEALSAEGEEEEAEKKEALKWIDGQIAALENPLQETLM